MFPRAKPYAARPIPLTRLDASDARLVQRIAAKQPEQSRALTLTNLDLWVNRLEEGPDRYELERIHTSLNDPAFGARDVVLIDGKMQPITADTGLALASRKKVEGDPPEVVAAAEGMPEGLWGQSHLLEDFVNFRREGVSTTRKNPSVIAVTGDPAHGKEEALEFFAFQLAKPTPNKPDVLKPAQRLDFNLVGATDLMVGTIFSDEAPLGKTTLEKLLKDGDNVLIRVRNMPTTAPKLVAAFNEIMAREAPVSKQLYFAIDFDGMLPAHQTVVNVFGAGASRELTGYSEFKHLDAPTMLQYFDARLPGVLKGTRLEKQTPVFTPAARQELGRALATRFAPLDELKPRMEAFMLRHVATQSSFDPEKSVLTFDLGPAMAKETKLAALHAELQRYGSRLLDAHTLFKPFEVARKPDLTVIEMTILVEDVLAHTNELVEVFPNLADKQRQVAKTVEKILSQAASAAMYGWYERVSNDAQYKQFESSLVVFEQALFEQMQGLLESGVQPKDPQMKAVLDGAKALGLLQQSMAKIAQRQVAAPAGGIIVDALQQLEENPA